MEKWIDKYIADYYSFLKSKTTYQQDPLSDWTVITTPFYGLFNDAIEIFVKKEEQTIFLSDDGQTLDKLALCGVTIEPDSKKEKWLEYILLNHGVQKNENELVCVANDRNFIQKKHDLLCAILEVSEMEITAKKASQPSLFKEEVKNYFETNNIVYTPQFIAQGDTGLDFTFDFQIASQHKEIIIDTFDTIGKQKLTTFLFGWEDIRKKREAITHKQLCGLAIINDTQAPVKEEYITALKSKSSECILWSQKQYTTPFCALF